MKLGLLLAGTVELKDNQVKIGIRNDLLTLAIVTIFLCWSAQKYRFDIGIYYYSNTLLLLLGEERIPSRSVLSNKGASKEKYQVYFSRVALKQQNWENFKLRVFVYLWRDWLGSCMHIHGEAFAKENSA